MEKQNQQSDIYLKFKAKKIARYKAGSDLSKKIEIEVIEDDTEDVEVLEIRVKVQRFKAGPELARS